MFFFGGSWGDFFGGFWGFGGMILSKSILCRLCPMLGYLCCVVFCSYFFHGLLLPVLVLFDCMCLWVFFVFISRRSRLFGFEWEDRFTDSFKLEVDGEIYQEGVWSHVHRSFANYFCFKVQDHSLSGWSCDEVFWEYHVSHCSGSLLRAMRLWSSHLACRQGIDVGQNL